MPRLFVIMPFGKREVPHAPSNLVDFNSVYNDLIRPAGLRSGWEVRRIDEVAEPGAISDHYLRELYSADLVLADISLPNGNVYYELGIRHGVASGGAVLIALASTPIPFDLSGQRVIFYDAAPSAWDISTTQITQMLRGWSPAAESNPVRAFLEKIAATTSPAVDIAAFETELRARVDRARTLDQLVAVWMYIRNLKPLPVGPLLTLGDRLAEAEEWELASDVLNAAVTQKPNDFEIHRKIGWCLQFAGPSHDQQCIEAFQNALRLNPNDPETLGMMGGRAKRLEKYDQAAEYYAAAARISPNSSYIRVNEAALNILSQPDAPNRGLDLYRDLRERLERSQAAAADEWTEVVIAECWFATGDIGRARRHYQAAMKSATSTKSIRSAERQLELFAKVGFRRSEAELLIVLLQGGGEVPPPRTVPVRTALTSNHETLAVPDAHPVLIHLSDIHFGSVTKDGKAKSMHRFYDGENSQPLAKHLEDEFVKAGRHFDFAPHRLHLIVSGDLVYTGIDEEYEQALNFMRRTTAALQISPRNVHLIPGNHDISWHLAKHNKNYRFDAYLKFLTEFYGLDLLREKYPLISWPVSLTSRPAAHEILSISYHPESRLLVAGLNSCVYETEQHHYGFVGERQLNSLRKLLSSVPADSNTTRIALIHHHLHPFPELLEDRDGGEIWVDVSTIRDAGLVERSLERVGFDLVLHGHKHKAQLRETLVQESDPAKGQLRRLIVSGAGTVSCVELEPNTPNQYEVIEIPGAPRAAGTEFLRIEWRILPVEPGAEWTTMKSWSILG